MTGSEQRTTESAGDGASPLKIMYRVDGTSDLIEETLDHFEGWRGSRPVRIGNGAAGQLQLDIYGEAMDAIFLGDTHGVQIDHQGWTALAQMVDWLCEHWDQPDEGIWETRGGRKDFTYGRFQCWVALDRPSGWPPARPAGEPRPVDHRTRQDLAAGHGPRMEAGRPAPSPSTTGPTCWTPRCCSCR